MGITKTENRESTEENFPYEYNNDLYKIVMQKEGGIQGCVKDKITMKPIPKATVILKKSSEIINYLDYSVTSNDGIFSLNNLRSGQYDISIQAEGYPKLSIPKIPVEDEKNHEYYRYPVGKGS